jgi:hypothetical protein
MEINFTADVSMRHATPRELEHMQGPFMSTGINRLPAQWQNDHVTPATGPGKLK